METPAKIGGRHAYTGRVISLDVDQVRFPDGSVSEMEMVRHPGASAIVPMLSDPAGGDPQLLLIRQYRYAAEGYLLEIPAGRLEPGESPEVCATRELREETGCSAERLDHAFTMYTTPGFTDERIHVFLATGLTRGAPAREPDELMEVIAISLTRALEMVQRNEIIDAKTALGILFVAGFKLGR